MAMNAFGMSTNMVTWYTWEISMAMPKHETDTRGTWTKCLAKSMMPASFFLARSDTCAL
jgi:hypothetical protein